MAENTAFRQLIELALQAGDDWEKVQKLVHPKYKMENPSTFLSGGEVDPLATGILNAKQHSLAYLYFLTTRIKATIPSTPTGPARSASFHEYLASSSSSSSSSSAPAQVTGRMLKDWKLVLHFTRNFSDQIWISPSKVKALATGICDLAERLGKPAMAVGPLLDLIRRSQRVFDPQSDHHQLTFLHVPLLKFALLSRQLRAVKQLLDLDLSYIAKDHWDIKTKDFLLYCYYGGNVYVGLKEYSRAIELYELCLITPANAISSIQIEAYRRLLLTKIVESGKLYTLPKNVSNPISRGIGSFATPYQDFAKAIEKSIVSKNVPETQKFIEVFARNNHLGLSKLCFMNMLCHSILGLTKTFITLSLADMNNGVAGSHSLWQIENEVLSLVQSQKIYASISHKDGGMVSFHDDEEKYDSETLVQLMEEATIKVIKLSKVIAREEQIIATSKDFVGKVLQNESRGERMNSLPTGSGTWQDLQAEFA
ncbi:COP9 signalosome complex subunit 3 [Phlyctochytrium planicorne]|nr:COP9 signalosome complex subunit 3 [Phlyctochytrium planicorne]